MYTRRILPAKQALSEKHCFHKDQISKQEKKKSCFRMTTQQDIRCIFTLSYKIPMVFSQNPTSDCARRCISSVSYASRSKNPSFAHLKFAIPIFYCAEMVVTLSLKETS